MIEKVNDLKMRLTNSEDSISGFRQLTNEYH
jgi:hypothetical protein